MTKFQSSDKIVEIIDKLAAKRREKIRNSVTNVAVYGTAYYVSENGCDSNDGLTPDTSWKSLHNVNEFDFRPGDVVFFRRGDIFRGKIIAKEGVTYSAYGEGQKPRIYASPFNGAKFGEWILTDEPDIYRYSEKIDTDIGCIIFNDGEANGIKATVDFSRNVNLTDELPFNSWRDLKDDLSFYHDLGGPNIYGTEENSTLYLKSISGNPSERFSSIEFNVHTNCITVRCNDVRVNNICIKYCGNHGIGGFDGVNGLKVDWCEFEWIGGSVQYYHDDGRPVRFGNAVEIWGECIDFTVEYCYINQVYDAGITHQFSSDENDTSNTLMKDIIYKNNLIENCIYSIEYFCNLSGNGAIRHMSHVRIFDNIMRRSGYGFGNQRPDKGQDCHIKSWPTENSSDNMIYENNILDRGLHSVFQISSFYPDSMPLVRRNIIVQSEGHPFIRDENKPGNFIPYTEEVISDQNIIDSDNKFYITAN